MNETDDETHRPATTNIDGWIRPSTPIEKTRVVTRRYHIVKEETPIQKVWFSLLVPRTPGSARTRSRSRSRSRRSMVFRFPLDRSIGDFHASFFHASIESIESSRVHRVRADFRGVTRRIAGRPTSVRRDFAQKKGLEYRQSRYATHARRYTHAREGKGTIRRRRRRRRQWLDAMRDLHSWRLRFGRRAMNE